MAAHGEATRTDLLLSNSRSHSTRLLFTGEDKVQSINAKQVLSLAHCVCRWFEEKHHMTLSLKPAQMIQKRNTQVRDPSTIYHSSLFHWQRFTRVGRVFNVLTQRHRAHHLQPVNSSGSPIHSPGGHRNS
ncbi:hypothetical protein DPX16_19270 [Anabarilius grahami]|uniref:Uncharacterized protein n=1 Tax=Anabarilius grahami TaxID=495550 RepID=A0A3N0Z0F3_ANAGA|nr:hypothetical protein DPX16_19270 [Anabarilius grahami]